ncbi:ATP-dependent RNA helicase DHX8 [Xylaria digitata]|nr:ATP-dependent RNA helicase DHX8 [Xylaria digitata]
MASNAKAKGNIKQCQIRAHYDEETITVYQAYNSEIASTAVNQQKLNASPQFRLGRMTWIKPSWCWMMYRAGYSYKDKNQERILALTMKHEHFIALLKKATLTTESGRELTPDGATSCDKPPREKSSVVKVQWDPERSPWLEKLGYRSIQIGIPGLLATTWADEWIVGIEDVTDKARALERELRESPGVTDEELLSKGLVPPEREFIVPLEVQRALGVD